MSILYIVGTPIGNLEDLTFRALRILKEVDAVACEDSRVSRQLLTHFQISKPTIAVHQHSQISRLEEIVRRLSNGQSVAYLTDAGTPTISDPGGRLIAFIVERLGTSVQIIPIPGPSALTAALSVCGFPADEFVFLGFPPHKKGRRSFFDELVKIERTVVFFESKHRILKSLSEIAVRVPARQIMIGRELTKLYETIYRGTIPEVTKQLEQDTLKGEFVIVLSGRI